MFLKWGLTVALASFRGHEPRFYAGVLSAVRDLFDGVPVFKGSLDSIARVISQPHIE